MNFQEDYFMIWFDHCNNNNYYYYIRQAIIQIHYLLKDLLNQGCLSLSRLITKTNNLLVVDVFRLFSFL